MSLIERRIHWLFIGSGFGCFVMAWYLTNQVESRFRDDSGGHERAAIIRALGKARPDPQEQVPFLVDALKDKSPLVRQAAIDQLALLGAHNGAPALLDAYKSFSSAEGQAPSKPSVSSSEPHPTSWGSAEGFAVAGGLCFLAAGLVFRNQQPAIDHDEDLA